MSGVGQGNPAVVGLAGFGMTTLLLQFHNLGWCGTGIVFLHGYDAGRRRSNHRRLSGIQMRQ